MISSMDFMASVAGIARASAEPSSANRPLKIGTVDAAYAGLPALPRVTFDGETLLSGKTYPFLSGYFPRASDRVVLAPVGTTYVIIGGLAMDGNVLGTNVEGEKWRTANQSRTNSAVLVDDDTLFFTGVANATYRAEWELLYSTDGTADMKVALTWPSGTAPWGLYAYNGSNVMAPLGFDNPTSGGSFFTIGGTGSGGTLNARIVATVFMGVTGGNVRLQFSQGTAVSGQSAVMRTGSRLTWKRLA